MKEYTIISTHRGRDREVKGTLEYLTKYFGYTLECGNSYNQKIDRNPKTIKSLLSNLARSIRETQGSCYDPDSFRLA
jgi:hypothetical protein